MQSCIDKLEVLENELKLINMNKVNENSVDNIKVSCRKRKKRFFLMNFSAKFFFNCVFNSYSVMRDLW